MSIFVDIILFLIGLLAGTTGSLVGLGGGFIIVPALVFLFGSSAPLIVGTATAVLFVNSISSTYAYLRMRRVDLRSALYFSASMIPGSIFGAYVSSYLVNQIFYILFGIFLMSISLFLVFKPKTASALPLKRNQRRNFSDVFGNEYSYQYPLWVGMSLV